MNYMFLVHTCSAKNIMPMPSVEDVARKEEEDFKILARGIWSIKPVDLNVSPGDKLSLESIFLNDPRPSVAKVVLTYHSVCPL